MTGHGLIDDVLATARRIPAATSVVDAGRGYTYRELDMASAGIELMLRDHGVRPGDAVAICLPRSWRLIIAMAGIRRLGATVVPLDAQSPSGRRRHILADSGSVALIEERQQGAIGPDATVSVQVLGGSNQCRYDKNTFEFPAFIFYTSGTTGQPKGVEVLDAGIARLGRPGFIRLTEGARYACLSNPAFDALSFEVWTPLLTGGCCVILDDETIAAPRALADALRRERVDAMFVTTSLFNAVAEAEPGCFSTVGQVLIGGEHLNAGLIRRWYDRNPASETQLYNAYGPTEATTFALIHPIPRDFDADVVPIGRPLPDTDALAVVDGSRLAAVGEVAELYIGGAAVAAGYRNLPGETGRRFVRLAWHDGGTGCYYRTGDLVRRGADGAVSYVGRTDRQVKVRGFRIEPSEVELRLTAHPAIRQAYVCGRRDHADGRHELLAYLVTDGDLSYAGLERHLAATLPPYMRPHRFYRVDALPRTANGKIDGDALLAGDAPVLRDGDRGDPGGSATGWQREVLGLVGEVLGVAEPRLSDTFIAVGGDSLASMRLRSAIRERWGCELSQAEVLRADLAGLASAIALAIAAARPASGPGGYPALDGYPAPGGYPAPVVPAGARSAPATAEQQRLWLLQQQDPGSCAYNVGFAFRLTGSVDQDALWSAVRRLVERHPALRTSFQATPEGLRQVVGEPYDPWLPADDAGDGDRVGWADFARRLFGTPFDLSRSRLMQACWLPDQGGGTLLLHMHHIAVDGRSLTVLFGEMSAEYAGEVVPAGDCLPTPLDYAAWQAGWFGSPRYQALRAELRDQYAALDEPAEPLWPARLARSAGSVQAGGGSAGGGLHVASIDAARRAALGGLGAQLGLTWFELLLGVFSWSVYGVTGRARPLVATPVVNRPVPQFDASVGMFVNTVLLPLRVQAGERLRALLGRQAADVRAVLDRQDVALADALTDHGFRVGGPLFDFMFVLDNTDFGGLRLPGCEVRPAWLAPAGTKCPLTLTVAERGNGFDCLWEYATDYFEAAEVEAMAGLFRSFVDNLGGFAGPAADLTVDDVVAPYRAGLPEPGRGAALPLEYTTIADGFARQVRRVPGATALVDGDRVVSYGQLDAYAATLAAELQDRFALNGRSCHVALRLEPSVEHVAALLALARLNVTAVPLDPAYPPALLRQILGQVRPACVLMPPDPGADADADGGADGGGLGADIPPHVVVLSSSLSAGAPAPVSRGGRRPLYTLFTSGSTGTPKGIQVPDLTVCNLLQWQAAAGALRAGAVTQQFSMLSFDVSFQEIFGTLCGGGTLHLIRPGWRHDMPALLDQLEAAGIERIHLPYVALQMLAEHGRRLGRYPSRLRDVVTAGEQLLCTEAIRGWFSGLSGARLFNHYGPTETHVVSALCLDGDPLRWPERPAIGGPVGGTWLRVVDEAGRNVPPDCSGELLIGGLPAVPCYVGEPELNASRFIDLPDAGRFYRSGDLARFDRQGMLHYLGRLDEQVKVSGHRLELGQVEAALATHPAVLVAAVALDEGQLVACAEFRGEPPAVGELAAHLAVRLPAYVRVDRFRRVAALPRTASGKLDRRRALEVPGEELRPRLADAAALTGLAARLSDLFEAVIGRSIGLDERFFDAGASSLGLMRFHLRATGELGLAFSIPDLFEHVTIRDLARFLDGQAEDGAVPSGQSSDAGSSASASVPASASASASASADEPIAIVGMAVRLPGADDLAAFWAMVTEARRGITHFEAADGLVGARSQMSGLLAFDPEHFGISRLQAQLMDPQQRHLLMACVQALAHAGLADPSAGRVGLVASCGENTYFQATLREGDQERLPDDFQMALHHDKDFLATKAAYHLGLTGPAFTVQAACASSLVAVHVAAGLLRQGDAEVMLVGGVLVDTLLTGGYRYRPQHIFSRDGHCRPFSDDASGTIGASGVAVVVLKPLRLARRDGDTVYALVTGSAVNNDGAAKLGYTAPALAGQREVIRTALRRSGRTVTDIGYVEAHGTGTDLGDPVEVAALRQAYDLASGAVGGGGGVGVGGFGGGGVEGQSVGCSGRIALASVKSQIGHLGAAAGVTGLIRAALAVYHGCIPPNIDFRRLNPHIGEDTAPFRIPVRAQPWPEGRPRVAAVSSFGIGGTNAHVVVEAPPAAMGEAPQAGVGKVPQAGAREVPSAGEAATATVPCLTLSASSSTALRGDAIRIADYIAAHPESYPQVLRHLQAGRPAHRIRAAAICPDPGTAVTWLRAVAKTADAQMNAQTADVHTEDAQTVDAGVAVTHTGDERTDGYEPDLVAAWLAGKAIRWPAGSAQPPWDLPPPAFALADYDFPRAAPAGDHPAPADRAVPSDRAAPAASETWPARQPEADWMRQPGWVRLRRAGDESAVTGVGSVGVGPLPGGTVSSETTVLVIMSANDQDPAASRPFEGRYSRVVRVTASSMFARVGEDAYLVDPADPGSLGQLLDSVVQPASAAVDWLHALPLAVDGPVGAASVARARWACLDTPAALLRAAADRPRMPALRTWWMSYRAQPADGPVRRPELGLLAGITEVGPQECAVDGHWLDLPGPDPADWAAPVAALLGAASKASAASEADANKTRKAGAPWPRRLALRQRYWWQQVPMPVTTYDADQDIPVGPSTCLVLGGTGGIGATIAAWLLEHREGRVALLARHPRLPESLDPWADRVDIIQADLSAEPVDLIADRIQGALGCLDVVVHAVGVAAGGLITGRDAATAVAGTAAKLNGALLIEHLVANHRPALVLYCSSMSAQLGGIGQLDYAAANGALDGFAGYAGGIDETTLRLGINWDIWREAGMARDSLRNSGRHQAHLAVGLTQDEARRVLDRALRLQLPQVLVSTTDIEQSAVFYAPGAPPAGPPAPQTPSAPQTPPAPYTPPAGPPPITTASYLADRLCQWLGLDDLDPAANLYDLGADSLTMIDLEAEIKERTGIDLTLSRLTHRASLAEVLALLSETNTNATPAHATAPADARAVDATAATELPGGTRATDPEQVTVEVWQEGTGSTVLCLVHPVGGDVMPYRSLVSALDDRLTVCLIADPALHAPELPAWSIAERAGRYHAALHARFPREQWRWRLAGWSFGAWVVVAMAAEAETAGHPADEIYLLDPPQPDAGSRLAAYDDAQLEVIFASELSHGGAPDRPGLQGRAYAERLARCGRANLASMAVYSPPVLAVTPARLWLAARPTEGLPAAEQPSAQAQRWQPHLPGLVGWHILDTTHDGVVHPPHVQAVAEAISAASLPVLTTG